MPTIESLRLLIECAEYLEDRGCQCETAVASHYSEPNIRIDLDGFKRVFAGEVVEVVHFRTDYFYEATFRGCRTYAMTPAKFCAEKRGKLTWRLPSIEEATSLLPVE